MAAPAYTPSTETRVYSIIFRIRWGPFTKMYRDHMARADSRTWVDLAVAFVLASGVSMVSCSFASHACSWEVFPFHRIDRGVNHLSYIGHQVGPKLIVSDRRIWGSWAEKGVT